MDNRKVSVIIPTFNRPWGLKRAIESVLAQTFTDFELLIVDDASEAATRQVVERFDDGRIRYIRQPINVGVSRNWGTGLEAAVGRYVAWLMDDDRYEPNFLADRVAALEANPAAILAFSGYRIFSEAEQRSIAVKSPNFAHDRRLDHAAALQAMLAHQIFIGASLYRSDRVRSVWPAAETYDEIVDFALGVRLMLEADAEVEYLADASFVLSSHPEQLSNLREEKVYRLTSDFLESLLLSAPRTRLISGQLRRKCSTWQLEWAKYDRGNGHKVRGWRKWTKAVRIAPLTTLPYRTAVSWLLQSFRRDRFHRTSAT